MISRSIYVNEPDNFPKKLRDAAGENPVFLCVGDPSVPEECVAPYAGTLISSLPVFCYGTREKPLLRRNVPSVREFVSAMHPNSRAIVICSATGDSSGRGCLRIETGNPDLLPRTPFELYALGDLRLIALSPYCCPEPFDDEISRKTQAKALSDLIADVIFQTYV